MPARFSRLWAAVIFLGNMMAMPVFFYLCVDRDGPYSWEFWWPSLLLAAVLLGGGILHGLARRHPAFLPSFLILLPGVWWAEATAAMSLYYGWDHDPRFHRLYQVPLLLLARVSEGSGEWYSPAYAVAMQDGALAFMSTAVVAALLAKWPPWCSVPPIRAGVRLLSVLLPWQPVVQAFDRPEYYAVAARTLAAGYAAVVVMGILAPVSQATRGILLGVGLVLGVTLAVWRLERYQWLLAGSLVAALVLLAYGLVETVASQARR
jgi:hypothetical protein